MPDRKFALGSTHDDDDSGEDIAFVAKDNGDGTYSLDVNSEQMATIINNQTTIIANQNTIISLLQGGIGVNILSGGGL